MLWRQQKALKRRLTPTTLHGATTQNTATFIPTIVRTANPTLHKVIKFNKVTRIKTRLKFAQVGDTQYYYPIPFSGVTNYQLKFN